MERVYGGLMKGQWAGFRGSCWTMGEGRGLVFGAFVEASDGVHELVHHLIADSMLRGYSKGGRVLSGSWVL